MVVDSSVWVDYFNGTASEQVERLDAALGENLIILGDLILTEVLQGFRRTRDFDRALMALRRLEMVSMVGPAIAVRAAENYRFLRARGVTVRKTIDGLIATYCIEAAQPLLFSDRDFQPYVDFVGLQAA